jgi:hypothetical protein
VATLGFNLSEVTISIVWKTFPIEKPQEGHICLSQEAQVCQHTHFQDTAINGTLEITAHEGREVGVQSQEREYLEMTEEIKSDSCG